MHTGTAPPARPDTAAPVAELSLQQKSVRKIVCVQHLLKDFKDCFVVVAQVHQVKWSHYGLCFLTDIPEVPETDCVIYCND